MEMTGIIKIKLPYVGLVGAQTPCLIIQRRVTVLCFRADHGSVNNRVNCDIPLEAVSRHCAPNFFRKVVAGKGNWQKSTVCQSNIAYRLLTNHGPQKSHAMHCRPWTQNPSLSLSESLAITAPRFASSSRKASTLPGATCNSSVKSSSCKYSSISPVMLLSLKG